MGRSHDYGNYGGGSSSGRSGGGSYSNGGSYNSGSPSYVSKPTRRDYSGGSSSSSSSSGSSTNTTDSSSFSGSTRRRSGGSGSSSSSSSSSTGSTSGGSSSGTTRRRSGGSGSSSSSSSSSTTNVNVNSPSYTKRRSDSYTKNVDKTYIQNQTNIINRGGNYHRDLTHDTRINKTTVIYNNNHYYQPTYNGRSHSRSYSSYSSWGGGFWAGYATASLLSNASYYSAWNNAAVGSYWNVPYSAWNPYYNNILATSPLYEPAIDYDNEQNWQTPPLNSNQDPLEQLAFYGQLKKPDSGWFSFGSHSAISAEEARQRLSSGQEVDVAGVAVSSFAQLAQIVPEMAKGNTVQGQALSPDVQTAVQQTMQPVTNSNVSVNDLSTDDLINKLPTYAQVYSPRQLTAEDTVNGNKVNRTMDSAEAVYGRPEIQAAIADWWKQNPDADRDALNRQINRVVTKTLVDDLTANGSQYAQDPTLSSNPVDYLRDPSSDATAVAYNQQAIQTVLNNATVELGRNLISKTTATMGQ